MKDTNELIVYSIGHGRHPWAVFLGLLQSFEIRFVCDVRSAARSRWVQFNGAVLAANLLKAGIGYEHLPECGGKTKPIAADLARGVGRILELSGEMRTAILCSESQPLTKHKVPRANCHRVGLLAPILKKNGASRIIHILPGGGTAEFDEEAVESVW